MALQSLILPIVSIFRSMGLNSARNALTAITKDFKGFSKQVGMAAGSFAAFAALTTARQFTVEAVEATQRFERNVLALNQIFEDAAPSLRAFTKEVESYGLSQQQAAQASVFLGSVLKQYGFDTQEANAETQNLVKLAQDLATTFGYDVQEALLAITALFRGEYDPIEKFGVAMKQNEINAVRAARGLGHLTGAAEMQSDAQIRLELLFERAATSMGAFERATNTLYGSQQRLNAVMANLQVAFGQPLQTPLANVNNIFADLAQKYGPEVVEIGEAIGGAIDSVAPTAQRLGEAFFELISPLEQVIELTTGLLDVVGIFFNPALESASETMGVFNESLEVGSILLDNLGTLLTGTASEGKNFKEFIAWLNEFNPLNIALGSINTRLENLQETLKSNNQRIKDSYGDINDAGLINVALSSKVALAAKRAQEELENMAKANQAWTNSWTARGIKYAEDNGLLISEVFKSSFVTGQEAEGTDYVGDFFRSIEDAIAKESARLRLTAMGASEGLIEAILGSQGWEEVFRRVIRDGEAGLQRLQAQFNKTAAGIDEVTEALKEAEEAQEALRKAIQKAVDEQLAGLEQELEKRKQTYNDLKKAADDFRRWSLDNIANIQVLPDVEEQLGRFESSVVSTIASMQSELQSAVRSGLIVDSDFNTLKTWVATETAALADLARSRDALAERYSLSEALITEYQKALTGSLRLTSLFSKLKDETETITVSETSQGVMKLGESLREFEVTVARSYEKTVQKVQDKSAGLLQGFRDMADKSRGFAENLRKLRDMGLDPMLFNELVSAGVEAGGETAQALVDGGSDTILEINDLFAEINQLGAELGMDVGNTMYEAGQDMTFGLLDGIRSEQEALYDEMITLAQGLSETFRNNLDIAVEVPVAAAKKALQVAEEAVEQSKQVNVGALVQIENIIRAGLKALAGPLSTEFRQGITEKVAGLGALYKDVFSGAVTEIPGITGGLTSGELRAAAMATGGPQVTQYYNITVSGGNRLQQQQTVEEIRKFVDQNGNLSGWVSV